MPWYTKLPNDSNLPALLAQCNDIRFSMLKPQNRLETPRNRIPHCLHGPLWEIHTSPLSPTFFKLLTLVAKLHVPALDFSPVPEVFVEE